jgi:hypothetical protein
LSSVPDIGAGRGEVFPFSKTGSAPVRRRPRKMSSLFTQLKFLLVHSAAQEPLVLNLIIVYKIPKSITQFSHMEGHLLPTNSRHQGFNKELIQF